MKVCNSSATRRCRWNGVFVTFRRVEWTTSYPEAARSCTPVVPASHRRLYFQKLVDDRAAGERDGRKRGTRAHATETPCPAEDRCLRCTAPAAIRNERRRRCSSGGTRRSPAGGTGPRPGRPADGLLRRTPGHGQEPPRSPVQKEIVLDYKAPAPPGGPSTFFSGTWRGRSSRPAQPVSAIRSPTASPMRSFGERQGSGCAQRSSSGTRAIGSPSTSWSAKLPSSVTGSSTWPAASTTTPRPY